MYDNFVHLLFFGILFFFLQSENISWIAYNSNWYELSIYEIRVLLLLIMRSQKPLTLTIGKYMKLSLETFANVRISFFFKEIKANYHY